MIKKARRMKVRFCGLSIWQMDLSSAQIPSFFFLKQKKTSLQIPFGIASVDVFTGEGGI
ncbi:hypothetical protein [Anaerotignum lactatifermentans]|uniref:hypothetical protein n=1 Tax=Anaerotignum lactatifermentans TaxID=160404 RepID=UPI003AB4A785